MVGATAAFGGDEVPVAGACVDQQAALFAESCWSAGEAKCTCGTGAFLLATTGAQVVRSGWEGRIDVDGPPIAVAIADLR